MDFLVVEISFFINKTQHKMLVPSSHRVNFFLQKPASQKTLERVILAKRYRYYYYYYYYWRQGRFFEEITNLVNRMKP
jgi:hypothetical protein